MCELKQCCCRTDAGTASVRMKAAIRFGIGAAAAAAVAVSRRHRRRERGCAEEGNISRSCHSPVGFVRRSFQSLLSPTRLLSLLLAPQLCTHELDIPACFTAATARCTQTHGHRNACTQHLWLLTLEFACEQKCFPLAPFVL